MKKFKAGGSTGTKVKTVVKALPEASVEDMFDHIKPTIKHHPEEIILRVGTDDLKNSDFRKVLNELSIYEISLRPNLPTQR